MKESDPKDRPQNFILFCEDDMLTGEWKNRMPVVSAPQELKRLGGDTPDRTYYCKSPVHYSTGHRDTRTRPIFRSFLFRDVCDHLTASLRWQKTKPRFVKQYSRPKAWDARRLVLAAFLSRFVFTPGSEPA